MNVPDFFLARRRWAKRAILEAIAIEDYVQAASLCTEIADIDRSMFDTHESAVRYFGPLGRHHTHATLKAEELIRLRSQHVRDITEHSNPHARH